MFENRYKRNGILTAKQQAELATKNVAVIGCGGLGGYVIEMLARLGVEELVVCDGDVFDETNLNRQILCIEKNLGENKANEACLRARSINSDIEVVAISKALTPDTAYALMVYHTPNLIIDAVDKPETKIMLEQICEKMDIPLVHGAINGWFGQVAIVMPGDKTVSKLYGRDESHADESYMDESYTDDVTKKFEENEADMLGNPAFTPAAVAALQVSEAVKVLLGIGEPLRNKIMMIDLFCNEMTVMEAD